MSLSALLQNALLLRWKLSWIGMRSRGFRELCGTQGWTFSLPGNGTNLVLDLAFPQPVAANTRPLLRGQGRAVPCMPRRGCQAGSSETSSEASSEASRARGEAGKAGAWKSWPQLPGTGRLIVGPSIPIVTWSCFIVFWLNLLCLREISMCQSNRDPHYIPFSRLA